MKETMEKNLKVLQIYFEIYWEKIGSWGRMAFQTVSVTPHPHLHPRKKD